MKKKTLLLYASMITLSGLPLLYLGIIYNSLPDKVALHFNAALQPDRIGDKSQLWIAPLVLSGVSLLVFLVVNNSPRFDPKLKGAAGSSTFNKLSVWLTALLTALNFLIILASMPHSSVWQKFLFPLLSLLLVVVGNYMNNIKPNYSVGLRLPWTLSDDDNWRKTHHLAGKLWFWTGIALTITSFFVPGKIFFPLLTGLSVLLCLVPTIYSYRLFKAKP